MKNIILLSILYLTAITFCYSQVTFTDISVTLGINDAGAGQGVVFLDVNNDGFLDIFLVNNNTPSKLWINTNGISFTESSSIWGTNITYPTRGVSAADYNNDGYIDIIIGAWQNSIILYKNTGTAFLNNTINAGMNFLSYGGAMNWIDYNMDGKIDVLCANNGMPPRYNYLFRNDNLNNFTNVAFTAGLTDSNSTLCLAASDYDNDGDLDVFCGNQTSIGATTTGILYKNNGNGTFTNVTSASGLMTNYYSWGAEWGDYNNDGYMDLFIANLTGMNQLFKNNGDGTFTDVAPQVGVAEQGQSYSCGWADYDNDGDLDLYVARGQNYEDKMYRNDGTTFTDVSISVGMGDLRHSACCSWGDYNNDGFLDLYLVNNGTENRLYKNNAGNSNNWIILKLQGVSTNRSAIGSRVMIKTGNLKQIREVEGGSGGKGQNSLPLEFGLGSATIIDSLLIRWQSGTVQSFTNINVNQILNLIEGQSIFIKNLNTGIPKEFQLEQNYPNPFNTTTVINYNIPNSGKVSLKIYDILGHEVTTVIDTYQSAGSYKIILDVSKFTSGIYFYKLQTEKFTATKKMILIK
ncbi:MAG: FG-GAP-like repeat-containing protein [Ignavibacteria bacterium]|nr:FG-GAP-like repeat-containing protein [Ignavibacteria bacterium]